MECGTRTWKRQTKYSQVSFISFYLSLVYTTKLVTLSNWQEHTNRQTGDRQTETARNIHIQRENRQIFTDRDGMEKKQIRERLKDLQIG